MLCILLPFSVLVRHIGGGDEHVKEPGPDLLPAHSMHFIITALPLQPPILHQQVQWDCMDARIDMSKHYHTFM